MINSHGMDIPTESNEAENVIPHLEVLAFCTDDSGNMPFPQNNGHLAFVDANWFQCGAMALDTSICNRRNGTVIEEWPFLTGKT